MLSFVEEIILLLLDDAKGELVDMPTAALNIVIAGAALMDLETRNRIDTDLEHLVVADPTPTGDDILDDVLARAAESAGTLSVMASVDHISGEADEYTRRALDRLVAQRILRETNGRFLWVFPTRRYPVIDDHEPREVKARLRQILLSDEIPDPRDIVLICLVNACMLFGLVLGADELERAAPRIEQLRNMDLIGRAVAKAVSEIHSLLGFTGPA